MGIDKEEPRSHLDLMSCGIRKTLPQLLGVRPGQGGCMACQGPWGSEWVNTEQEQQTWERRLNEALEETFQERVLKPQVRGWVPVLPKTQRGLGGSLAGGLSGMLPARFPSSFWGRRG